MKLEMAARPSEPKVNNAFMAPNLCFLLSPVRLLNRSGWALRLSHPFLSYYPHNSISAHRKHFKQTVTINIGHNRLPRSGYCPDFVAIFATGSVDFAVAAGENEFLNAVTVDVRGNDIADNGSLDTPFMQAIGSIQTK